MLELTDRLFLPRTSAATSARFVHGLSYLAHALCSPWRRSLAALERRKVRCHLEGLPDHLLRDIGLMRDQIDEALEGPWPR